MSCCRCFWVNNITSQLAVFDDHDNATNLNGMVGKPLCRGADNVEVSSKGAAAALLAAAKVTRQLISSAWHELS
jgi:hypothetical protein